jgi:hypothetical protein
MEGTLQWVIAVAVPALAALAGVFLGAWMSNRRDQSQRRVAFIERQLREFYGPLLSIRTEIRTLSELRVRIESACDAVWQRLTSEVETAGHEALVKLKADRWPSFEAVTTYDNEQLRSRLVPSYRKMLDLFRDNLWLAEPSTRSHFSKLAEFVEIWERHLAGTVPKEVPKELGHAEANLDAFYENLNAEHDRLRTALASGTAKNSHSQ